MIEIIFGFIIFYSYLILYIFLIMKENLDLR